MPCLLLNRLVQGCENGWHNIGSGQRSSTGRHELGARCGGIFKCRLGLRALRALSPEKGTAGVETIDTLKRR